MSVQETRRKDAVAGGALPRHSLSTADATVLVVGLVLGVGIFRTPQLVAANSGGVTTFLLLWTLGGLVSLVGALCYAELASAYPHSGGEYHFVSRALGAAPGFLFAWSRMTVLQTGSIAILAYVFADYAAPLLHLPAAAVPGLAAGAVVVLTAVNLLGLRPGRFAQYTLTIIEVAGLLAVVAAGLLLPAAAEPASALPAGAPTSTSAPNIGMAMVFVLLTFGGWSEAAYLSAEVRDRRRGISRALLLGIAIITALYLLANLAYLRGLGLAGVEGSATVAADLVARAVGPLGSALVSAIVMVSALSSANAATITGSRCSFAIGRDVTRLSFLASWSGQRATPSNALLLQGMVALVLIAFGAIARSGFEAMVAYTAPVFWLILLITGISLFVLRRRDPRAPRPFRVPLYPLTPALFCAASAYMLYSSLAFAGPGALLGLAVMVLGIPVFGLGRLRPASSPPSLPHDHMPSPQRSP
jgi:basic amino acid/polyamine antiporter, APA family